MQKDDLVKRRYLKYWRIFFKYWKRLYEYSLPATLTASDYDGEGHPVVTNSDPTARSNWVEASDPIIPTIDRGTSQLLEGLAQINNATIKQYSYFMVSHKVLPEKTAIKVDDKNFLIERLANYKEVVGFNLYFLKGRDDLNGLSKSNATSSGTNGNGVATSDYDYFTGQ